MGREGTGAGYWRTPLKAGCLTFSTSTSTSSASLTAVQPTPQLWGRRFQKPCTWAPAGWRWPNGRPATLGSTGKPTRCGNTLPVATPATGRVLWMSKPVSVWMPFVALSTPRSGRSSLPPPPWGRRAWTSTGTATRWCTGTYLQIQWTWNNGKAGSIGTMATPFAKTSRSRWGTK